MAGISLAEIDAATPSDPKKIYGDKVCPRQSEVIFCSNPTCKSIPLTNNRLALLKLGWKVINGTWYCPHCPKNKEKNENEQKYTNLIRI